MKTKKLSYAGVFLLLTIGLTATSCRKEGCTDETAINYSEKAKKDDGSCQYEKEKGNSSSTIMVSQNITENTTWTNDKVYVLNTRVTVEAGVTLTIEPGTIIKGEVGTGPNATVLIIARGAKLMAEGTATSPIIFTTIADEITPGQIDSPNMSSDLDGLWGGLIVLGNAPISADNPSIQIEGIPPSDQNGLYGGSNPSDNSGVLKYISIRHGGANIGEGNEINGLTLGGVGTGTVIENIEVVSNQDDGVEWFGGTVNTKNVIVWNAGDDAIDTDQAWSGTLDNFIVISGESTDHALEVDGPEGSFLAAHTLKNGSIKGGANTELADFRDGARTNVENIYFFGFPDPSTDGRGDFSLSGQLSIDNYTNGDLNFTNIEVTLPNGVALTEVFKNGTDSDATSVAEGANTVGADASVFVGWTLCDKRGELTNF
ncbi:hypothetical protein CW751_11280 [Brumimicrobium salinarum]|uniref:T9SS C-terminal target domain-containing protein n=1 Tax=Brumimicrobium salinarum TaxID=2058658 RepID=A0A2I0R113_9FLAO|nr:hypothetical protein [Brumimicrobium salinarum]PKR80235.1 hypothetical protein CW751_11280 [Brumimicrobium salinarum]